MGRLGRGNWTGAGAAGTFTDPAGDAVGGATDISQVAVSNDFEGTITFALTTDRSAFTTDDLLVHILPLHHVHGIINGLTATLLAGGAVEMYPKFDPAVV